MIITTCLRVTLIAAVLPLVACQPQPLIPFSRDTPAMILLPVSEVDVIDGRGRFREIYTAVRDERGADLPDDRPPDEALNLLADEPPRTGRPVDLGASRLRLRFVFIPGLFGSCVADSLSPFPYGRPHIEQFGYATDMILVSGRSSSRNNGTEIRDALLAMNLEPEERVVLVGYSKGTVDAIHAVVDHREVRDRVTAIVSIAGAYGGSPLADEASGDMEKLAQEIHVPGCPFGDRGAIDSLKRSTRQQWITENQLPSSVRYYSLAAFAERPQISSFLQSNYDKIAMLDPRNDSQVTATDAIIPGGTLLGFANCDHWTVALAFSRDMPVVAATMLNRSAFPREVLLESVARYVEEDLILRP